LSVLLPVRDAQSTLAATVLEILDILPELTPRFELIVIDDGSKDATFEVADDLEALYPQIRVVRHAKPLGHSAAIRTGLRLSSGEVIFLRDHAGELALDEVRKLWWALDEHPMVVGRPRPGQRGRWLGWKRRGGVESLRMVDRRAVHAIQESLEDQAQLMASMARQDDSWFEVEIGRRHSSRPAGPIAAGKQRREDRTSPGAKPTTSDRPATEKTGRPKYLRSLRNLVLGR
jgi:glycosyltransferase involved in cell wall biosynthesis